MTAVANDEEATDDEGAPWQHHSMVVQREKAVAYAAERVATLLRQQRKILWLAMGFILPLSAVLLTLGQLTMGGHKKFTIAAYALLLLAMCALLACDYDINESLRSSQAQFLCVSVVVFTFNLAVILMQFFGDETQSLLTRKTWPGAASSAWQYVWIFYRQREIRAQLDGYPLPTELVTLHFLLYFLGHLVGICVRAHRAGWDVPYVAVIITIVGSQCLFLHIGLARTRWGQRGPHRRPWLATSNERTTPTQRGILSACLGIVCWVLIICWWMLFPLSGKGRVVDVPILYLGLVLLPLFATWHNREAINGALSAMFERRHRLQDGGFVASLLGSAALTLKVGDAWWVNDPEALPGTQRQAWFRGSVTAIEDGNYVVDLPAQISLPASVRRRTHIPATARGSPEELVRCACMSLFQIRVCDIDASHLARAPVRAADSAAMRQSLGILADALPRGTWHIGYGGSGGDGGSDGGRDGGFGSAAIADLLGGPLNPLRVPCRPGETDWFLSHSWHDNCAAKERALAAIGAAFRSCIGREPTVWFDKVCVHPAFRDDSLHCVPVYLHACRGVLILCGPTYFTRLWCVWELYTLFAFSEDPSLLIAVLHEDSGRAVGDGVALRVMQQRLERFKLSDAHCFDPNEERQLRAAIHYAPGGALAFQATMRGLAKRLVDMETLDFNGVDMLRVGKCVGAKLERRHTRNRALPQGGSLDSGNRTSSNQLVVAPPAQAES